MLTIHHLRISQSERIVWLCEELGLEYDLKLYNRDPETRLAPPELKALHPMQIAPLIEDGPEDNKVLLGESGAIVEYIVGKYAPDTELVPGPDHPDFADHLYWFHFANATFMTNGMMQIAVSFTGAEMPAPMMNRVNNAWGQVERRLGEADYFGGSQLTTADIMMVFQLTTSRAFREQPIDDKPNLQAYLKRIGARDAYQRAMAKAEPGFPPKLD
ncbi:MAG: glutathione S-transferase [Pseudomonadota bacterium]